MINCKAKEKPKAVKNEKSLIFSAGETSGYNHHACIAYFKGKFYSAWSSSPQHEDDCGQRIMMSVSKDFYNWCEPFPIIDSMQGRYSPAVLLAGGMSVFGDTLYLYFGHYEYAKEEVRENGTLRPLAEDDTYHTDTKAGYIRTEDGENWSKPEFLNIPGVPNHAPSPLHSGRLLMPCSILYPYSDDPSSVGEYKFAGIYGDSFGDEAPYDDSVSINAVTKKMGWNVPLICEGAFFQTDDDVIHMMLRTNSDYLWCAESRDNAESWSQPYQTEFTDDKAKFHFGRLPDGRFYYVGNCVPGGGRLPLMLCVSEDGENFDRHYTLRDEPYTKKYPGLYKGGVYGYPVSLAHDGYLYVIYSKHKEAIEVTRVALSDI